LTLSDRWLLDGGDMDINALFSCTNPAVVATEVSPTPYSGGYPIPSRSVIDKLFSDTYHLLLT